MTQLQNQKLTSTEEGLSNARIIQRLLFLAWRYRKGSLLVLFLQIVLLTVGLSGLSLTGLGLDVINHGVTPGTADPIWPFDLRPPADWTTMDNVVLIAGLILFLALVRAILNYAYGISLARLVQLRIIPDLRNQVYDKLQRLSFRFFDANASGSIINRVTGDVQAVRMFIDGVLMQLFIMVLSLAVYITYMVKIHFHLTLACLATIPLLWVTTMLFSAKVRPQYVRNRELMDDMILKLSESVQGIHTVKGFGREDSRKEVFEGSNRTVKDQQENIFWKVSLYSPFVGFLSQVNLIVLLSYGGWLVFQGELAIGTGMVVFAGLLQQFSAQVSNFANVANTMQRSLTGARRVFEILDAPVEIESKSEAVRLPRARGKVQYEHVGFAYKQMDPVLKDIDFTVEPGQCVAVVGATGSGKSAMMSLLPRFYDPTSGCVRIDGIDVRELNLEDLRRNIGIVFQESFLFSNTVAANIAFGQPEASMEAIIKAAKIAQAHDFIMEMPQGYETVLGEVGVNLSGGQRQRLAIARAILLEPPILLLDDPTASIDPETENEIMKAIDHAIAGRTTFIVAHRLSTLRRADLIIVLEKGRMVQKGTHEELYHQPGQYRQLARLQVMDDLREREQILNAIIKTNP